MLGKHSKTQLYSQPPNNVLVIVSQTDSKPRLMFSTFIFQQKAALEMGQHQDKDLNFSHRGLECFQQNMESNQVEQVIQVLVKEQELVKMSSGSQLQSSGQGLRRSQLVAG